MDEMKAFKAKVLDSRLVPDAEVRHLFCEIVRKHSYSRKIIEALGIIYANRSSYSQPPSNLARSVFHKILLPLIVKDEKLLASFYTMLADKRIPSICLLAVINAVKRSGRDPWWLINVAITFRPLFADIVFRHRQRADKTKSRI